MKNRILIGTTISAEILIIICNVYLLMSKSKNIAVVTIELICAIWVMLFTSANRGYFSKRNKKKNK